MKTKNEILIILAGGLRTASAGVAAMIGATEGLVGLFAAERGGAGRRRAVSR